tara:strand:- start:186 stop:443 length:258 start_codon:yes stop_codon:yes gene_type:complete
MASNYQLNSTGVLVASGEGVATIFSSQGCEWTIGSSAVTPPVASLWAPLKLNGREPMNLKAGQYLWARGTGIVGTIADNPAAGSI